MLLGPSGAGKSSTAAAMEENEASPSSPTTRVPSMRGEAVARTSARQSSGGRRDPGDHGSIQQEGSPTPCERRGRAAESLSRPRTPTRTCDPLLEWNHSMRKRRSSRSWSTFASPLAMLDLRQRPQLEAAVKLSRLPVGAVVFDDTRDTAMWHLWPSSGCPTAAATIAYRSRVLTPGPSLTMLTVCPSSHLPSVTVVIPTWRRRGTAGPLHGGGVGAAPAPSEILVVARPEDDETLAVIDGCSHPGSVRWVEVNEPGHVPPVRAGLEAASSDLVAFIDDDAVPPGWLAALLT